MKINVLLCNCKGLCDSFKDTGMNTLPFSVESDLDIGYVALHPQTCGKGGNELLKDLLTSSDDDTCIISGACAPKAQEKLFKKILRETGFPAERFLPVDIRSTDNDGIVDRLRQKVEEVGRMANSEARTVA